MIRSKAPSLGSEIGSAFLASELQITQDCDRYLANWLKLLKSDPRTIFTAAARAAEAVKYLKELQQGCLNPIRARLLRLLSHPPKANHATGLLILCTHS